MPPVSSRASSLQHDDLDRLETDVEPGVDADGGSVSGGRQGDDEGEGSGRPGRPLVIAGLLALLVVPLLVALAALRRPQWFPILDLAMTELRVRDVGTRQTPLIGLPGRIGVLGQEQGSHPGPLSFWLLAPTYRLFGTTAWAMQVATVVLHTAAMAVALWLANRRGGLSLLLGVAAVLGLLTSAYGTGTLTEAWNPYMPLLWWVVMLLAVWSVLNRDVVGLPIAIFAGSICAQTHAPYALLVIGMGGVLVVGTALALRDARSDATRRRRIVVWFLAAAVLGAVLWTPPVIDQFRREPGNISLLIDHFGSPPEESVGLARGVEMTLLHLDPWRLLTKQQAATGSLIDASQAPKGSLAPGALMLVVWLGAVALAWKLRHRALLRLHAVVAVALVLATVSISRIFGQLWYYLMTWAWGITSLLILATGWSIAAFVARRSAGQASLPKLRRAGAIALVAVTVASSVWFSVDATNAEVPAEPLSDTLAALVPDATEALRSDDAPGRGPDGRYLVMWTDALYIGSQGIALVNELDRSGFEVGVVDAWGVPVGKHRIWDPDHATALVHLATGFHVERWREKPGVEEIAYVDPRSPEEVVEYERLRDEVVEELRAEGLEEQRLIDVTENLFAVAIDPRVPKPTQDKMTRMLDMGLPTAIFVGPVDARE